jgi:hypothetical protein
MSHLKVVARTLRTHYDHVHARTCIVARMHMHCGTHATSCGTHAHQVLSICSLLLLSTDSLLRIIRG